MLRYATLYRLTRFWKFDNELFWRECKDENDFPLGYDDYACGRWEGEVFVLGRLHYCFAMPIPVKQYGESMIWDYIDKTNFLCRPAFKRFNLVGVEKVRSTLNVANFLLQQMGEQYRGSRSFVSTSYHALHSKVHRDLIPWDEIDREVRAQRYEEESREMYVFMIGFREEDESDEDDEDEYGDEDEEPKVIMHRARLESFAGKNEPKRRTYSAITVRTDVFSDEEYLGADEETFIPAMLLYPGHTQVASLTPMPSECVRYAH